jgi:periplasmic divalent cation tolerance protein
VSELTSESGTHEFVLGYVTTPNRDLALSIARAVVDERLAACANIVAGMTSIYHWNGGIQTDEECVLLLKTRRSLAEQLSERVVQLHGYECPCVVFVPVVAGNPPYLAWLGAETVPAR